MSRTKLICFTIIMFSVASIAFAISQQSRDYSSLLAKLSSSDWQEREAALQQMTTVPGALKSSQVKKALVDLLEQEDQLVEATLRESSGRAGVSVKYGEGYSEYYSALNGTVEKVADFSSERTLQVLARSTSNPTSPLAMKLAGHGETIVPALLERANSDVAVLRGDAIGLLSHIGSKFRSNVSKSTAEHIDQALTKGMSDKDPYVKVQAIRAISKVGSAKAIPLLEQIAESDDTSAPIDEGTNTKFPIREEARKAIKLIKQGSQP